MRKRLSILLSALCALCVTMNAQDYARLSERSLMGTARYVGMGGAMTAIGGDPSAVSDNPAGLGLYQRWEIITTLDAQIDRTYMDGLNPSRRNWFTCTHASLVFALPTYSTSENGVQFNNLLFSYRRLHSFHRSFAAGGTDGASLGALVNTPTIGWDIPFCTDPTNATHSLKLNESGYVNEYAIDWSINIGHKWYVGAGLRIQSYSFSADAIYYETFSTRNLDGERYDIENKTSQFFSGAGCNLALGLIYRPAKWVRLGLSMQTPSLGTVRTSTYGTFSALTDTLRYSYAPDLNYTDRNFHMPWRTSASVAFQCGAYGLLSLQYDFAHGAYRDDTHSLRTGLEIIPVMGMYINAGYAFESTFKGTTPAGMDPTFDRQDTYSVLPRWTQYASCAIGYRGSFFIIQAAYQYRWQRVDMYAHEAANPYDVHTDTHRIVVTLGWHNN